MKLTKSHKVYLLVLGLAATGLAVDRLFLGPGQTGPAPAQAVPSAPAASPSVAPAQATAAAATTLPSVAARLAELARREDLDPASVPEAFVPPKSWTVQAAAKASAAQAFAQTHRLTSIVFSAQSGSVTVGDKMITAGQVLDGFRLVSILRRSVLFESVEGGDRVELRLESPAGP